MRGWRFPFFLFLGLVLSIGVACNQASVPSQVASTSLSPSPVQQVAAPAPKPRAVPSPLPPETAAIVATAGPGGLYNPPRGDVRLAVISDLNSSYGSTDYDPEVDKGIQLMPFWQPDLVLCGGDMVAGQNLSLTKETIQAMWTSFDRHVAAPLRQAGIPFGFTVGNHDASSARGGQGEFLFQVERNLTAAFWRNPKHDPGVQFIDRTDFPFYYTFEFNDIFFMAWDGSSSQIPAEKLAWVEKTLASPKAQQAKMRVLVGHLPLYGVAVGRDKPGEVLDNADQLRALLERYKVHTYISGHQHAYYPAHKGNLQLLHSGLLGSGPRRLIAGDVPLWKTLTIIDVNFNAPELTTYTTYNIETLQPIQYNQLPRTLTAHNGVILRRDVSNLNAAEQAACEQKLETSLCQA